MLASGTQVTGEERLRQGQFDVSRMQENTHHAEDDRSSVQGHRTLLDQLVGSGGRAAEQLEYDSLIGRLVPAANGSTLIYFEKSALSTLGMKQRLVPR